MAGNGKHPVSRRGASIMVNEQRDASRSEADWAKMTKENLVLKCNFYGVEAAGIKSVLCRNLFNKFHPTVGASQLVDMPPGPSIQNDGVFSGNDGDGSSPTHTNTNTNTDSDQGVLSLGEYSSFEGDSSRESDTDAPARKRRQKKLRSVVRKVPGFPAFAPPPVPPPQDAAVAPALQPGGNDQSIPQPQPDDADYQLAQAEIRALRSELNRLKVTQPTSIAGGNPGPSGSVPQPKPFLNPAKRGRKRSRGGRNTTTSAPQTVSTATAPSARDNSRARAAAAQHHPPTLMSVALPPQAAHAPPPAVSHQQAVPPLMSVAVTPQAAHAHQHSAAPLPAAPPAPQPLMNVAVPAQAAHVPQPAPPPAAPPAPQPLMNVAMPPQAAQAYQPVQPAAPPAPHPPQYQPLHYQQQYYNQPAWPQPGPPPLQPPAPQPQQPLFQQPLQGAAAAPQLAGNSNPFLPPSIKVSILKKIYRREFVDFEELLPGNQTSSALAKHESCISIDKRSHTLKFDKDKVKNEKVDSFSKWLLAWNSFLQAHLHYHPEDYYNLMTYQKLFCQLVNKYRFDACASYDRYFRLSMANQQTLSADLRSVSWVSICEEYRAMYLIDNPLPHCFTCKSKGHFAQNCPDKKTTQSDTPQNPTVTTVGSHTNFRKSRTQSFQNSSGFQQQPQQVRFPQFHIQPQQQQQQQFQPVQQQQQQRPALVKPCYRYNGSGQCAKPPCQFLHICSICFRDSHPAKDCYAQSSSVFRPGAQPGNPTGP